MKKYLSRKNIAILAAALLIASVSSISLSGSGRTGFLTNAVSMLSHPFRTVASSLAHRFETVYGQLYNYDRVVSENAELKKEIADLRQQYREYTDVAEENIRLHGLLGLSERHTAFKYDTVSIIAWSASTWTSSFTVSKGSDNSAIKVGDAVITETNVLIGRISEVGTTQSTAVSIIDTAFSAGVHIGDRGGYALLTGDYILMRRGLSKLGYLAENAEVLTGDTIVTSGRGGVFPEGLVIGTVSDVLLNETGIGMYAEVQPDADLKSVSFAYVITSFDITE